MEEAMAEANRCITCKNAQCVKGCPVAIDIPGFIQKVKEGNIEAARKAQLDLIPLINALFSEVNPIPAKAAMAAMGYCEDYLRLPLTPMEDAHKAVLLKLMAEQNLI